jgi:hypothetical protein
VFCFRLIDQVRLCAVAAGVFCTQAGATDYYVDAEQGSDDASGVQQVADGANGPWRSLARINTASIRPGDRILLKCGAIWNEAPTLTLKGTAEAPVTLGAYGECTGRRPEIRPMSNVVRAEDFREETTGWSAPLGILPGMVFSPNAVIPRARFPVQGWLGLKRGKGTVRIAQTDLPVGANIVGADWVVRTNDYTIEVRRLYGLSPQGEATIAKPFAFPPLEGMGYYLEGQPWMLRHGGGWAYDVGTRRLYVHNRPAETLGVNTSLASLTLAQPEHVRIQGLGIRFSPGVGVEIVGGRDVELNDLDIADVGLAFVRTRNTDDIRVTKLAARRSQQDGVAIFGGSSASVTDSQIVEVGTSPSPRKSIAAVLIDSSSSAVVARNRIDRTGYAAIMFGRNAVVERNAITQACMALSDCGAIYTSGANKKYGFYASRVSDNLISDVPGNVEGTPGKAALTAGVYLDDEARGIEVSENFIERAQRGIFSKATASVIARNTLFDNIYGVRLGPTGAHADGPDATQVEDNFIISKPGQMPFLVSAADTGESVPLIRNRLRSLPGALASQIWRGPMRQASPEVARSVGIGRAFSLVNTSQERQSFTCPSLPKAECTGLRLPDGAYVHWPVELMPGKAVVIDGPVRP